MAAVAAGVWAAWPNVYRRFAPWKWEQAGVARLYLLILDSALLIVSKSWFAAPSQSNDAVGGLKEAEVQVGAYLVADS